MGFQILLGCLLAATALQLPNRQSRAAFDIDKVEDYFNDQQSDFYYVHDEACFVHHLPKLDMTRFEDCYSKIEYDPTYPFLADATCEFQCINPLTTGGVAKCVCSEEIPVGFTKTRTNCHWHLESEDGDLFSQCGEDIFIPISDRQDVTTQRLESDPTTWAVMIAEYETRTTTTQVEIDAYFVIEETVTTDGTAFLAEWTPAREIEDQAQRDRCDALNTVKTTAIYTERDAAMAIATEYVDNLFDPYEVEITETVTNFGDNYEGSFDERIEAILADGSPAEDAINQELINKIDSEMYALKTQISGDLVTDRITLLNEGDTLVDEKVVVIRAEIASSFAALDVSLAAHLLNEIVTLEATATTYTDTEMARITTECTTDVADLRQRLEDLLDPNLARDELNLSVRLSLLVSTALAEIEEKVQNDLDQSFADNKEYAKVKFDDIESVLCTKIKSVETQLIAAKERDWETLLKQSEAFAKASSMRMRLNSISNIYKTIRNSRGKISGKKQELMGEASSFREATESVLQAATIDYANKISQSKIDLLQYLSDKKQYMSNEVSTMRDVLNGMVDEHRTSLDTTISATKSIAQTQLKIIAKTIDETFPDMTDFDVATYSIF